MTPRYADDLVTLYRADCRDVLDLLPTEGTTLVLDPPFDLWPEVPIIRARTVIAFLTWQYRDEVVGRYGRPRAELVWTFDSPRWVSHSLPLTTHETILVFGPTGDAYVGDLTDQVPVRKGSGSVGRDTYPTRTYVPRERKALTTTLAYPRTVHGEYGLWQKPVPMLERLLAWAGNETIVDPFAGSGSTLVAAKALGYRAVGVEYDERAAEIAVGRIAQDVLPW